MTVAKLVFWIAFGIGLQLVLLAGWAFWRHWLRYQELQQRLERLDPGRVEPVPAVPPLVVASGNVGWSGWRSLRVARKHLEDHAGSICSFELLPVDGGVLPAFLPGQFLTLHLSVPDAATGEKRVVSRCYSLSDRPGLRHYRISVKRVPGGVASNHLHDHVQVGDVLSVLAPAGRFVLEPGLTPVVLIAGGIGITPLVSMILTQLAQEPQREVWFFYGVRDASERAFHGQLRELSHNHPGFRYLACHSQSAADTQAREDFDHAGRVDITLLRMRLALRPYHFFLCGPTAMIDTLRPALAGWGVLPEQIHTENFGPSMGSKEPSPEVRKVATPPKRAKQMVTFRISGKKMLWDTNVVTLLEFAEQQGIDAPFGCRSGACGACQTGVTQGEVEYLENPDFTPDPGTCLLCVTRPRTDLTLTL
ncbi:MAG: 2Fe-2S iron-sulfur cluster binding domain-containing protein [Magnetococcales bacterium]|nr:2Fe-2S iron-sulfur cluster binding domain-containing protein [Magnetococcales bacterium]NGZ04787.1 2Fe-2S iron-sulfur cluster binding domain-containing protein [Magnetococcales bacterium]